MSQSNSIWASTEVPPLLLLNSSVKRRRTCIGIICIQFVENWPWWQTFIVCLLLASQNDKLQGLTLWNTQGQLDRQTASTTSRTSEMGDEADWCFLVSFIDLCDTSVSFVMQLGYWHVYWFHLLFISISASKVVILRDKHVCHLHHSTGSWKDV